MTQPQEQRQPSQGELFAGTAEYYARYRSDYPDAVYAELERAFQPDGSGTLLDLGTGTGQIAFHLASRFERVVGLDVSAEMLETAARIATERGVTNIDWQLRPAEELASLAGTPSGGPYRLITLGSVFHWMDQPRVLELAYDRTAVGGGIFITALPGFITPDNVRSDDHLAVTIMDVVRKHLGERRRAGSGFYGVPPKPWIELLAESRYEGIERGLVPFVTECDVDAVIGMLYSTSFANRRLLGVHVDAFEADLRSALLAFDDSGRYQRRFEAKWVLVHRR